MNPYKLQVANDSIDLTDIYGNIHFYPYARYALYEFLKVNQVSSVYAPSFICRDLLSAINELNIKYHYYELNEDFSPNLKDIKCDAIIFINYFGFSQDISPFQEYKERYGSFIIEDNAHGFLSKDQSGSWLATRGDIGLLSIRKTLFLPNGAALVVSKDFTGKVPNGYEFLATEQDKKYSLKRKLKKLLVLPQIGLSVLVFLRLIRFIKTGSVNPLPDKNSEYHLPENTYVTPILESGRVLLDLDIERERRVKMYALISRLADKFDISPIFELYDGVMPFEFSFIDNGNGKKFEGELYKHGLYILPWPDLPDEVVEKIDDKFSNIKVVPFLW